MSSKLMFWKGPFWDKLSETTFETASNHSPAKEETVRFTLNFPPSQIPPSKSLSTCPHMLQYDLFPITPPSNPPKRIQFTSSHGHSNISLLTGMIDNRNPNIREHLFLAVQSVHILCFLFPHFFAELCAHLYTMIFLLSVLICTFF